MILAQQIEVARAWLEDNPNQLVAHTVVMNKNPIRTAQAVCELIARQVSSEQFMFVPTFTLDRYLCAGLRSYCVTSGAGGDIAGIRVVYVRFLQYSGDRYLEPRQFIVEQGDRL